MTKIAIYSPIMSFVDGEIFPLALHTIQGPVTALSSLNILEWENFEKFDDYLVVAYADRTLDYIDVIKIKSFLSYIDPD